jgi:hypothetical protein
VKLSGAISTLSKFSKHANFASRLSSSNAGRHGGKTGTGYFSIETAKVAMVEALRVENSWKTRSCVWLVIPDSGMVREIPELGNDLGKADGEF